MKNIKLKPEFVKRYSEITDFDVFMDYSLKFLRRSIRVNTIKMSVNKLKQRLEDKGWQLEPIKWCEQGFFVEHNKSRIDIGNLVEHSLGYFYVQEASSMIPPIVMRKLSDLSNKLVLDMCAAPGSKTTQIAMYMQNTGMLIANDYLVPRLKPLGLNIQRAGITNTIITLMPGQLFKTKPLKFDAILVDAPCSATGAIRKSLKTLEVWNPNMVKRLARIQKQLLESAYLCLKPGGVVVYSTCTLEPEENEGVVSYLLDKYDHAKVEKVNITGLKTSKPLLEFGGITYNPNVAKTIRIWPQDNDTQGFFIAAIRKRL